MSATCQVPPAEAIYFAALSAGVALIAYTIARGVVATMRDYDAEEMGRHRFLAAVMAVAAVAFITWTYT